MDQSAFTNSFSGNMLPYVMSAHWNFTPPFWKSHTGLIAAYSQGLASIPPRLVLTGLDFGEAGTETVSAPFILEAKWKNELSAWAWPPSSLLCLSGVDSLKEPLLKGIPGREVGNSMLGLLAQPLGSNDEVTRVGWEEKQVILPQIPETLVWVIKLVMVIPKSFFFSFSQIPCSFFWTLCWCQLGLFCLFSCVFFFPYSFPHLFPSWKVPFIVPMCALTQIVTWSNHTHCCLVLLFPHMLSFGISPLPPDFWLRSEHLALP